MTTAYTMDNRQFVVFLEEKIPIFSERRHLAYTTTKVAFGQLAMKLKAAVMLQVVPIFLGTLRRSP